MGKHSSKNVLIYLNGANISAQANTFDFDIAQVNPQTAGFTEFWDTNVPGTNKFTGSFGGFSDGDGSSLIYDTLHDLAGNGPHDLLVYPQHSNASYHNLSGQFNLQNLKVNGQREGALGFSFQFEGTGALANSANS